MTDLPPGVERDYPLQRLTTVRTGGPADYFARPETEAALVELLAWAGREGIGIGIVGSGSNLLVADEGFCGLVMKLAGELTAVEWSPEGARDCPRRRLRRRAGDSPASSSASTSPARLAARCA
jgi:hypothetical protein